MTSWSKLGGKLDGCSKPQKNTVSTQTTFSGPRGVGEIPPSLMGLTLHALAGMNFTTCGTNMTGFCSTEDTRITDIELEACMF